MDKKQIFIAPAMNTGMWENQAVQKNIETLKNYNVKVIEPESGFLACGTNGVGRLAEVSEIFDVVASCSTIAVSLCTSIYGNVCAPHLLPSSRESHWL